MAQVQVFSKIIGSRPDDPSLDPVILRLFEDRITVEKLIRRTVEEQINDLLLSNRMDIAQARRALNRQYLTQAEINEQLENDGAVHPPHHKEKYSMQLRFDIEAEVARALGGFEQGAYTIMVNGGQMERLDEEIVITLSSKITFLRLTPLVGG